MYVSRTFIEKNRTPIAVTLLFALTYLIRVLFGTPLSAGEIALNLPFYLLIGLLFGKIIQLVNLSIKDKGLISLLIYPVVGMLILIQFLIPPVYTMSWETTAQIITTQGPVADVLIVPGNCKNTPLGYTTIPLNKPADPYELGRLIRFSTLGEGCSCHYEKHCHDTLQKEIMAFELLNETDARLDNTGRVFTLQGAYLAMPLAEEGCHYTGFVKFIIIPSWNVHLREGGKICFD